MVFTVLALRKFRCSDDLGEKIVEWRHLHRQHLKWILPSLILFVFTFVSGGIFYAIEHSHLYDRVSGTENATGCLGNGTYMETIFFLNTLHTTIGYGNVYPCTALGRAATVVYSLIGIPLAVLSLDGLGKTVYVIFAIVWTGIGNFFTKIFQKCCRCCGKRNNLNKIEETNTATKAASKDESPAAKLPMTTGIVVYVSWILLTALYFAGTQHWDYGSSVYFTFITLLTIGLGDLSPDTWSYTIAMFIFIFIGLSLIAMFVSIIQDSIEDAIKAMDMQIQEELEDWVDSSSDDSSSDEDGGIPTPKSEDAMLAEVTVDKEPRAKAPKDPLRPSKAIKVNPNAGAVKTAPKGVIGKMVPKRRLEEIEAFRQQKLARRARGTQCMLKQMKAIDTFVNDQGIDELKTFSDQCTQYNLDDFDKKTSVYGIGGTDIAAMVAEYVKQEDEENDNY